MDLTTEQLTPGYLDSSQTAEVLVGKLSALSSTLTTLSILPAGRPVSSLCKDTASLLSTSHSEVQILSLCCMTDLFRVCAPTPPFNKDQTLSLFKLFSRLAVLLKGPADDPKAVSYMHALKVLAEISALALCYKYKESTLVGEVVDSLLEASSRDMSGEAARAIEAMVVTALEEANPVQKEVLIPVVTSLTAFNRDHRRYTLVSHCLRLVSSKTILAIDDLLSAAFTSSKPIKALRSPERYEILYHLYKLQPSFVLQSLTHLSQDIALKDKPRLRTSLQYISKLISFRTSNFAVERSFLFTEFINHFDNPDKDIKIALMEWTGRAFKHWNQGTDVILMKIKEKLEDACDKVRVLAVQNIGKAAKKRNLEEEIVKNVCKRLRDKSEEVRRETRLTLLGMYEDNCLELRLRDNQAEDFTCIPNYLVESFSKVPLLTDQIHLLECLDDLLVGERTKEDSFNSLLFFFSDLQPINRPTFTLILQSKKYWMGQLIELFALKGVDLETKEPYFSANLGELLSTTQEKGTTEPKHSPIVLDILRDPQYGRRFMQLADESLSFDEKRRVRRELIDIATEKDTYTLKTVKELVLRTTCMWVAGDLGEVLQEKLEKALGLLLAVGSVYTSLLRPLTSTLISTLSPLSPSEVWSLLRLCSKAHYLTSSHFSHLQSLLPPFLSLQDTPTLREITLFAVENYAEDFVKQQFVTLFVPLLTQILDREDILYSRMVALGEIMKFAPAALEEHVEFLLRFILVDLMLAKTPNVQKKDQSEVSQLCRSKIEGISLLSQFSRNQLYFSASFNSKRIFSHLFRLFFNLSKYTRKTSSNFPEIVSLSQCFSQSESSKIRSKALGEVLNLLGNLKDLRELLKQRELTGLALVLFCSEGGVREKFVRFLTVESDARTRILPQVVAWVSVLAGQGKPGTGYKTALAEVVRELRMAQGDARPLEVYVVYLVVVLAGHEVFGEEGLAKRCLTAFLASLPSPLNTAYLLSLSHLLVKLDLCDPRPCSTDLTFPPTHSPRLSLKDIAEILSEAVRDLQPGEIEDKRERKVLIPGHFFKLKAGMESAKKYLETSAVSKRSRDEDPERPSKRLSLNSPIS